MDMRELGTYGQVHPRQIRRDDAKAAVRRAVRRYIHRRRAMIPEFVERNFELRGALKLHRHAVGRDLLRAPANLVFAVPNLVLQATASVAEWRGREETADWLRRRQRVFVTDISREVEWRLFAKFLELPYAPPGRPAAEKDALAEEIARDPAVERTLDTLAGIAGAPRFQAWARETAGRYGQARVAVADLATSLVSAGIGAAAFKQWTPGALSLGPVAAQALAQQAAVASFPLGAAAGGLWYGLFPAAAPGAVTVGLTGGLVLVPAMLSAFAGVVTDPIQAALGVHRRRLERLLTALENQLLGEDETRLGLSEPYVARILDLVDLVRFVQRTMS